MENEVRGRGELVGVCAVIVAWAVPGAVEADLGAELDGRAYPLIERDSVLGVAGLDASALTFLVIEEVGAERDVAMEREFLVDVIHHGVFGRGAA